MTKLLLAFVLLAFALPALGGLVELKDGTRHTVEDALVEDDQIRWRVRAGNRTLPGVAKKFTVERFTADNGTVLVFPEYVDPGKLPDGVHSFLDPNEMRDVLEAAQNASDH